jgi:excinuclease ABC subunit C
MIPCRAFCGEVARVALNPDDQPAPAPERDPAASPNDALAGDLAADAQAEADLPFVPNEDGDEAPEPADALGDVGVADGYGEDDDAPEAGPETGAESAPGNVPRRSRGVSPDEIDRIPQLPGVYVMRDGAGRVIYIGKAANLASRVRNYFTKGGDSRFSVRFLLRHVEHVETIVTANEKEAFLLENTLIKKHQPRYNLRLRDDKTYVSARVNLNHPWPRAVVMRRRETGRPEPGVLYLGPYSSAAGARDALRQLQRVFPIRSCPDHVLANRTRPCLLHQIGRCCAPCTEPVDPAAYREMVEQTVLTLKGKTREVVDRLREQMARHAGAMEYERAAILRDRLRAIEGVAERQGVHRHEGGDRDAVAMERQGGFVAFVVFAWRGGLLVSSRPYLARDHDRPAEELMEEFIGRYYQLESPPAEVMAVPEPAGRELLEAVLAERREGRVQIATPQRGEKRQLVETALENARQLLAQHLSGRRTVETILAEIQEKLRLAAPPRVIECFDVSTIQGTATVASMVTFRDGEPDKSRYRRFRVKTLTGQDDFGAMREVLTRRLRRVADGSEAAPGLLVVDGGKGQLAQAVDAMAELGLAGRFPVAGMAKSRVKRRAPGRAGREGQAIERTEERFFLPGRMNPVTFAPDSPALHLLARLRDEAHRFAIAYHRELRGRQALRSTLEDIEGVGKTRAAALLRHFGSMKKLREATADQIAEVKGIPRDLAERIYQASHPAEDARQTSPPNE